MNTNRPAKTAIPPNSIADSMFLEDAFDEIIDRLKLLGALDIQHLADIGLSHAISIIADDIVAALKYHQTARTPWAHGNGTPWAHEAVTDDSCRAYLDALAAERGAKR